MTPMDRAFAAVVWRCALCDSTGPCGCWARERERLAARRQKALDYIGEVGSRCDCAVLGGEAEACGCSPRCDCHMSEDEAAEAAERATP